MVASNLEGAQRVSCSLDCYGASRRRLRLSAELLSAGSAPPSLPPAVVLILPQASLYLKLPQAPCREREVDSPLWLR